MKFEIYLDASRQWRWKLKAKNNKIIAVSGESYKQKASILKVIRRICEAEIVEVK